MSLRSKHRQRASAESAPPPKQWVTWAEYRKVVGDRRVVEYLKLITTSVNAPGRFERLGPALDLLMSSFLELDKSLDGYQKLTEQNPWERYASLSEAIIILLAPQTVADVVALENHRLFIDGLRYLVERDGRDVVRSVARGALYILIEVSCSIESIAALRASLSKPGPLRMNGLDLCAWLKTEGL